MVNRKQSQPFHIFFDILSYFEQQDSNVDVILGDFNINALLPANENSLRLLADFTHISGLVIDHIYVRTNIVNSSNVVLDVVNLYFSVVDAVRTIFEYRDLHWRKSHFASVYTIHHIK